MSLGVAAHFGCIALFDSPGPQLSDFVIWGHQGFGFEPEEVLPLGSFPKLTSLTLSDALEARISRFVCLESLSSLKVTVIVLSPA